MTFIPVDITTPKISLTEKAVITDAPHALVMQRNETCVYIPNISPFDFWEDWKNSKTSRVFAEAGISIQEG